MDENIKEKLKNAIQTSFDKWNTNYVKRLLEQQQGENWEADREEARLLDLFLSKRVFIYGFYRHVADQIQSNPVAKKQRKFLLKAIIQSIVNPEGVTAKYLEKKTGSNEGYTYTHTRRVINDDYPEIFMESNIKDIDSRLTPYKTVFTLQEFPEEYYEKLQNTIENNYLYAKTRKELMDWLFLNAGIRPVTPEYLSDLKQFLRDTQEILKEIQIDSEEKTVLQAEMKSLTDISTLFHSHFQSMMAVEWWRNRQLRTKKKLLNDGFPLKYTKKDATTAHELLLELTNSTEHTYWIMHESSIVFDDLNLSDPAIYLCEACLNMDYPSNLERGILYENIATMYRKLSKPKLMVIVMKKAIEQYRLAEAPYRVCVGLKNLGEAEWNLGYKEAGARYFSESETLGKTLGQADLAGIYWNLASASKRVGEKKMECDYLLKCMTMCTDDQTHIVLECDRRLSGLRF